MLLRNAVLCLVVLAGGAVAAADAQESALSYTRQQSEQGRTAYLANCVACHGPHLSDGPLGKPLKGPEFMHKYGGHSVRELYDVLRTTMPSGKPGSLDPATYAALVAYLLQQNAIVPRQHEGSRRRVQHHGLLALHAEEGSRATQSPGSLHPGR
jgi:mono/diheme cytochrome c family protein